MKRFNTVFAGFLQHIVSLHDMPELLIAEITRTEEGTHTNFALTRKVTPRGQTSIFIKELEVTVSMTCNEKGLHYGSVNLSYQHIAGGSNGYRTNFAIASRKQFGVTDRPDEYLGAVEVNLFNSMVSQLDLPSA